MNIIVGATGQVGSYLIQELKQQNVPVRALVRNLQKLSDKTIESREVDLFNVEKLVEAFQGGTTAFVLTPENPVSNDIIGETKHIVQNYKTAIQATGIKKVVALSCIGAHIKGDTGNILMSRILEQGLDELSIERVYIRPSYYFSNWLAYMETADQHGVLPTFFSEELQIEMHSPIDLAKFIAKVIIDTSSSEKRKIYELTGQEKYTSRDVADVFSKVLNRDVTVQPIEKDKWQDTLLSVGFTVNAARNLADMTQAVIDNLAVPEYPNDIIKLPTTLTDYLKACYTPSC
ncbi:NmrA family NAD(P)-binding protein [Sphingobacterium gobiense]|uniref:Nucleoside-diphosphate sugar epimerase n=1 Tax=Sphingobacterium gobiense TaxID=1382456 RepID=A0A2S9JV23_9SPHI|nr:NmrA family NAD(P)-binding protein [Sphingobacterium gobiense]PRD57125.1 nucleoside-diphosphate sugar epimerase [Sphingobacterium gobiense]